MAGLLQRFATRLLLGLVLAVVPLVAVLAFALVTRAGDALEEQAEQALRTAASTTASRTREELGERRTNLRLLARDLRRGRPPRDALAARRPLFEALQLLDRRGRVLDGTGAPLLRRGDVAFADALAGRTGFSQPARRDGTIRTVIAEPVPGRRLLLAGDLDETFLVRYLAETKLGESGDANVRLRDGERLWSTILGERAASPRDMAARGALVERALPEASRLASEGRTGTARYRDTRRMEVIGGYAPVQSVGWSVVVTESRAEAFAAVDDQRDLTLLICLGGLLLLVPLALWLASRTTSPVRELAQAARAVAGGDLDVHVRPRGPTELRHLAEGFNAMVASLRGLAGELRGAGVELAGASHDLLSASQELASTTAQQSAAAQETSSTMEELAQTSSSIAGSTEGVADHAQATQDILERADAELAGASERLRRLAERSVEVGRLVTLIEDVAERTNLLSLNAAIEAARAGEAGAGFAVVADEVRLLADRSRAEASKISEIVRRTQDDVAASVMALETGSKEMRRGLDAMAGTEQATAEVRVTTEQQRVATDQVVDTMLSMTSATKQTADTARQLARSAGDISALASRLEAAVQVFRLGDGTAGTSERSAQASAGPPAAPADHGSNGAGAGSGAVSVRRPGG